MNEQDQLIAAINEGAAAHRALGDAIRALAGAIHAQAEAIGAALEPVPADLPEEAAPVVPGAPLGRYLDGEPIGPPL